MAEHPRTVLVVDDVPEIVEFFAGITRRMEAQGVRLETETDPGRALDRLKTEKYDLVVSDFRMRGFDGIDVLKAAKAANPQGHRILMTGYNEIPTPIARIQQASVDAYLQKPLRMHDLMLLLLDFLHENEASITTCRQKARELEQMAMREERAAK